MELKLIRISKQSDSTSGILLIDNEFACYTLEDEEREVKVWGETAIPKGKYEIKFRNEGGFHNKYSDRFKSIHKGMLELQNVRGFEFILIHCGNTDENTAGCILIGDSQENNILIKDGFIGKSSQAYSRVYPIIAKELEANKTVTIEIKDLTDYMNTIHISNASGPEYINSSQVFDKLSEISGQLITLTAKMDGKSII